MEKCVHGISLERPCLECRLTVANASGADSGRASERAEAAEAKLAAYEAPVGDGEVEGFATSLELTASMVERGEPLPPSVEVARLRYGAILLRRLSATIAQRDKRIEELEDALREAERALTGIKQWCQSSRDGVIAGHRAKVWNYIGDRLVRIRAALSPAGETGS